MPFKTALVALIPNIIVVLSFSYFHKNVRLTSITSLHYISLLCYVMNNKEIWLGDLQCNKPIQFGCEIHEVQILKGTESCLIMSRPSKRSGKEKAGQAGFFFKAS